MLANLAVCSFPGIQLRCRIPSCRTIGRSQPDGLCDICSWITLAINVIVWVIAFRVSRGDAFWSNLFWALVVIRLAAFPVLNDRLGPRIALLADRVAWYSVVFSALLSSDWWRLIIIGSLWAAWSIVAGLGRYWFNLVASDDERVRAAELAKL